jgi:hypothetical protein
LFFFEDSFRYDQPESPDPALTEAGFGPPVRVVFRGIVGGVEHFETDIQHPLDGAEAEQFQAPGGADLSGENVECGRKDTPVDMLPDLVARDSENVDVFGVETSSPVGVIQVTPSLVGKCETSPEPEQKLHHPRTASKPETRSSSKTKPSPKTKSKSKPKPKRERTLTISPDQRAEAERSFFVAEALGCPFNMKADLNPGLDHLGVEGRIAFCKKIEKNFRAYVRSRCLARGMSNSWWPDVWGWVRESERGTNLEEHVHFVFYAPEDERRPMVKLMEEKRKATDPKVKKWCENAMFALIDSYEHWTGAKFESAFGYFAKMANPQDYHSDSTIGYKKSGFITGPRIKFSPFLTNPEVVEATRVAVQALEDRRDKNRAIMRANGSKPALDPRHPRSLVHASRLAPADSPAAEPSLIEQAICPEPRSADPVHGGAEHCEMDVRVEIETQPVESAPAAQPAMSRELDFPAAIEAGDVTPPIPVQAAFVPDPVAPVPAEATSASSSPGAILRPLARIRRSVARGAAAGVGWIASRFRPRPSPSRSSRPTPLVHPATVLGIGAIFGAPDIGSTPW